MITSSRKWSLASATELEFPNHFQSNTSGAAWQIQYQVHSNPHSPTSNVSSTVRYSQLVAQSAKAASAPPIISSRPKSKKENHFLTELIGPCLYTRSFRDRRQSAHEYIWQLIKKTSLSETQLFKYIHCHTQLHPSRTRHARALAHTEYNIARRRFLLDQNRDGARSGGSFIVSDIIRTVLYIYIDTARAKSREKGAAKKTRTQHTKELARVGFTYSQRVSVERRTSASRVLWL